MAFGFRNSLVFRLLGSIALVMVLVLIVGNTINVRLAQQTLSEQGERQIEIQRQQHLEQIEEGKTQLTKNWRRNWQC